MTVGTGSAQAASNTARGSSVPAPRGGGGDDLHGGVGGGQERRRPFARRVAGDAGEEPGRRVGLEEGARGQKPVAVAAERGEVDLGLVAAHHVPRAPDPRRVAAGEVA